MPTTHPKSIAQRKPSHRLTIEVVERRRLLASAVAGNILTLTGTSSADAFVLTRNGTDIIVSENGGLGKRYASASVTQINADLGGSNDYLDISDAVTQPVSALGGSGNDTLLGGGGGDTLDGGLGNDCIDGGAGLDRISYLNRLTAISGSLNVALDRTGVPSSYAYSFRGHGAVAGASGETDTFDFIESITGSAGNDTLAVYADDSQYWNDVPGSARPSFTVDGQGGDDELGASTDYAPSDFYDVRTVDLVAKGGLGDDVLTSYEGLGVKLVGEDGDDHFSEFIDDSPLPAIDAGAGIDSFYVRSNVGISYTMPAGLENIDAGGGTLLITGNALDNQITAYGPGASDSIDALGGNDLIIISNSSIESIDGGAGRDTISYALSSTPVTVVLNVSKTGALTGTDGANTFSNVESFLGGVAADTFTLNSPSASLATAGLEPIGFEGNGGNDTFNLHGLLAIGRVDETAIFINGGSGSDLRRRLGDVRGRTVPSLLERRFRSSAYLLAIDGQRAERIGRL